MFVVYKAEVGKCVCGGVDVSLVGTKVGNRRSNITPLEQKRTRDIAIFPNGLAQKQQNAIILRLLNTTVVQITTRYITVCEHEVLGSTVAAVSFP